MKRVNTLMLTCLFSVLTGCQHSPAAGKDISSEKPWGPTVDGLRCRLYVPEHDSTKTKPIYKLTLEIENVGNKTVSLPLMNVRGKEKEPELRIKIEEEPDVCSPLVYGGVTPGTHKLLPGEVFTFLPCGPYMIGYGKYSKQSGWFRFNPEDKEYHLTAELNIGKKWIRSNRITIRLPKLQKDAEPSPPQEPRSSVP